MDDLASLDHDSPHDGDDIKHAPKTPKKKHRKEKDIDATNDAKKKDKEKQKPVKSSKQQKKDKKAKAKPKIPASSSALSQTKKRPTTITGSTCVGLSTREFSHKSALGQDGDGASSSSSGSPGIRTAVPLMTSSPSSHLGSRASRGSMPQFASSPELLDLSSVRSRPKSSSIASSDPAVPPPAPATTKRSPGKEKNAHSSSGFDATANAKTRSRSGSSECVMEGFLEEALLKRVGSNHTRRVSKWRKRWVRLLRCDAGTFLLTHDKPLAVGKKPTSVRSRIDVLAMVTTEKRDDVRRYAFVLMPDDCDRQPPSYLCADTEGARKSWMAAITRVQRQEVSDIVQPLRSKQQEHGKEKEDSELRPGMTSLDFDDLAEDKRRKRTMVLVNGEEKKREKVLDIQEEQDQISDEDSEEARMMRDIERRVQELSAAQHPPQQPSGFGPSAPALSMSSVPAYYHPQQHQHQHQHQQQQVLLRQQSYSVVGSHHHAPGSTLSGSYNPFVEVPPSAAAVPHHLQPQTSPLYYMQPPVRRGSFVAADLSSSHSALPQAQTVVMSTLSAAASPSTSTSVSSVSPHGTPPAGMPVLPSPHIPPPFMRQSSSIHMAAAHHNSHHHLLSSAPSAVAQS